MRDYDKLNENAKARREPAPPFPLGGREWVPVGAVMPAGMLLDLARVQDTGLGDSEVTPRFLEFVLGEDQAKDLLALFDRTDDPVDTTVMQALAEDLVAHYTGRPTGRPVPSHGRPPQTSTGSRVVSLSREVAAS